MEFVDLVESLNSDVHVVAAYGQILSMKLLDTARNGGINLHGSILPQYRGAAPIQRCLLNGDTITGVTLMQMDKGMDTGDMIDIATTPIGADETYGELQTRLSMIARDLADNWIARLASGQYPRTPQNSDEATYANKVDRREAELSFCRSGAAEYNRFRAFTPSPSVFLMSSYGRLKIKEARLVHTTAAPGQIVSLNPLTVAFHGTSLALVTVQPEGKPAMPGAAWALGKHLSVGDNLS